MQFMNQKVVPFFSSFPFVFFVVFYLILSDGKDRERALEVDRSGEGGDVWYGLGESESES
jgi:hypothetical protein